jgi:putative SbcD/Mre11-related phosphoesterase
MTLAPGRNFSTSSGTNAMANPSRGQPGSTFAVAPGLTLDARRAVWLEEERILAIADPHLGYAWAHRASGQLMPLGVDDASKRLQALLKSYQPRQVVVLGDIVHRAVAQKDFEQELHSFLELFKNTTELVLLAGNHDRNLKKVLDRITSGRVLQDSLRSGPFCFLHGDVSHASAEGCSRVFMGHEHPAIYLGDGVSTREKFPCFLVSDKIIVLPAFSRWAAGSPIGSGPLLSPITKTARFNLAVAILENRLLPVPLKRELRELSPPCSSQA